MGKPRPGQCEGGKPEDYVWEGAEDLLDATVIFRNSGVLRAVDGSQIGCFDCHRGTGVLSWNKNMYHLFDKDFDGRPVDYVKDFQDKLHPDDRGPTMALLDHAVATHGKYNATYRVIWRTGETVHIKACGEHFANPDGSMSLVGTCLDVTEVVRLREREVEHLLREKELEARLRRNEEMHRLLRTVSHETRNPLQGILANSESLKTLAQDLLGPDAEARALQAEKEAAAPRPHSGGGSGGGGDGHQHDTVIDDDRSGEAEAAAARAEAAAARAEAAAARAEAALAALDAAAAKSAEQSRRSSAATEVCSGGGGGARRSDSSESAAMAAAAAAAAAGACVMSSDDLSRLIEIADELNECAMHQVLVINDFLDFDELVLNGATAAVLVINDFLDFDELVLNGAAAAAKPPKLERVDVNAVAASVASMFLSCAKNKRISLSVAPLPHALRAVRTDRLLLQRVLMNLVSNAVKFTECGAVTLEAAYREDAGQLVIEVQDTGCGIPDYLKAQLFHNVGVTTSSQYATGSGLGLPICKALAAALGGAVALRDRHPRGTVLRLTLPCAQAPREDPPPPPPPLDVAAAAAAAAPMAEPPVEDALQAVRVLVAEDNKINQKVLARMLRGACAGLTITGDGREAVNAWRAARRAAAAAEDGSGGAEAHGFELALFDIHMPVMGGREAAAELRKDSADTPIIFLTGEIGLNLREDLTARFSPCTLLHKPCARRDLLQAAAALLWDQRCHAAALSALPPRAAAAAAAAAAPSPPRSQASRSGTGPTSATTDEARSHSSGPDRGDAHHHDDATVHYGDTSFGGGDGGAEAAAAAAAGLGERPATPPPTRWYCSHGRSGGGSGSGCPGCAPRPD